MAWFPPGAWDISKQNIPLSSGTPYSLLLNMYQGIFPWRKADGGLSQSLTFIQYQSSECMELYLHPHTLMAHLETTFWQVTKSRTIITNISVPGLTTVGMLLDVVVWWLGRGLDLYEETNTEKARVGSWRVNFYCDNKTTCTFLPISQSLRLISNNSLQRWYKFCNENEKL